VLARAQQRHDGEVQRRLSAGGGDATHAAFERRDPLLEHRARRIGDARIDVTGALHVEERRGVVAVREYERCRLVDRRGARAGLRIRPRTGMQRQRVEVRGLGLGHRRHAV
jgi:hypothetical protein